MIDVRFPHCTFERHDGYCRTVFPGIGALDALPQDTEAYRVQARELGYGDDAWALCWQHEFLHSARACLLHDGPSPTLLAAAKRNAGQDAPWFAGWRAEASAVFDLQRLIARWRRAGA
jgi:hypothetical protein